MSYGEVLLVEGPDAYFADPCVPEDTTTERLVTENGNIEFVRTPSEAFFHNASFPYEPKYVTTMDGLRMHYIDEGPRDEAAEIVLMLHGQPTWCYLYRKMIPVFVNRGMRAICIDLMGMGKSDKPIELNQHTYGKHVDWMKEAIQGIIPQVVEESSPVINLFVQDWGSMIGLRIAGDNKSWFRRIITANGGLVVFPPGVTSPMKVPEIINYNCSDTRNVFGMALDRMRTDCGLDVNCFQIWIKYALTGPLLTPSEFANAGSPNAPLSVMELAQYDAPYPSAIFKSAIRVLPSMVGRIKEPEFGNAAAWESLQQFDRPFLFVAGEKDLSLGSVENQNRFIDNVVGAKVHDFEHKRYPEAGHFIQEDVGAKMANYVADFIEGTVVLKMSLSPLSDVPSLAPNTVVAPSSNAFVMASPYSFHVVVPLALFLVSCFRSFVS